MGRIDFHRTGRTDAQYYLPPPTYLRTGRGYVLTLALRGARLTIMYTCFGVTPTRLEVGVGLKGEFGLKSRLGLGRQWAWSQRGSAKRSLEQAQA